MLPNGKDIEYIVIERIEFKESENIGGRTEQGVWIAYFAKNEYTNLPMVLNSTNRKRIAKLFPQVEGCINLLKNIAVRLTREKTRDVQDGGETWGLRISRMPAKKPTAPKKDVLSKEHPNWTKCVAWLVGGKDIEALRSKYQITKEVEDILWNEASVGKQSTEEATAKASQVETAKTE